MKFKKSYFHINTILIVICLLLIISSSFYLLKIFSIAYQSHPKSVYLAPGHKFEDMKQRIAGVKEVGFLTDKDMSSERNDGEFLKAQYMLSPTVLDLGNINHKLFILDCTSLMAAYRIMKNINAEPLYINPYGKILAMRKQ